MIRAAPILFVAVAVCLTRVTCEADATTAARGGRVGWARLLTPAGQSGIHSDQDPKLARFIGKETSLNIDPVWYTVGPDDLAKLCSFPFLYVKDVAAISSARDLENMGEYLRRGGFVLVDPCVNGYTQGQRDAFVQRHVKWFARVSPGSVVRELPDSHAIYRCYFNVGVDDVFSPDMIRAGAPKQSQIGLLGVFQGDRMIAAISLSGLECGWPQTPGRMPGCMKMIVNAYVYAMTRSAAQSP
jgi:hypothetical protein